MEVFVNLINGISLGIEYVAPMPDDGVEHGTIVVDLLILRIAFLIW